MYVNDVPDEADSIIMTYTSEKPTAVYLMKTMLPLYFIYIISTPTETAISTTSGKMLFTMGRTDIFICEISPITMNIMAQKCPSTVSKLTFARYFSLIFSPYTSLVGQILPAFFVTKTLIYGNWQTNISKGNIVHRHYTLFTMTCSIPLPL